jgi:hypothetical protein
MGPRGFGKTLKCIKREPVCLMKKACLFKNPNNHRY